MYKTTLIAALAAFALAPLGASAQEWADYTAGGLLLQDMDLERSPGSGSGMMENAVGMNGHVLKYQPDSNVCIRTSDDSWMWCISDDGASYADTAQVNFRDGQLRALDASGNEVWASPNPGDSGARLVLSNEGRLESIDQGGNIHWSWGKGGY